MRERAILDAGPLVDLLKKDEGDHAWAIALMSEIPPPYYTCEAVLTEASHLVLRLAGGPQRVLDLVSRGVIIVHFRLQDEAGPVHELMRRYADVPMSLADACLVRMAEQHEDSVIITTDSDFRIYRRNGRHAIPLLTPQR